MSEPRSDERPSIAPPPVAAPASVPPSATRAAALDVAMAALDSLADLGESVEDEWTYVTALADAGRSRLRRAVGADPGTALARDRAEAVVAAAAEAARITDPHRAIDWLSTLPAVVELALAEAISAAPPAAAPASTGPAGSTPPAAANPGGG